MGARSGLRGVVCVLLAGAPAWLFAQVPAGPEFRVNTYTTGDQREGSVAVDAAGNFVVAWDSPQDGSNFGVFAQRFAGSGARLGAEFRVNTYTTAGQYAAAAAFDSSGGFVVVWNSYAQDGFGSGVFGQRFDAAGVPRGGEFRVTASTSGYQTLPAVACGSQGSFVVSWTNR